MKRIVGYAFLPAKIAVLPLLAVSGIICIAAIVIGGVLAARLAR